MLLVRREEGQAVDVFGATADERAFEVWGSCRRSLPYSDGAVSGRREGKVGRREADGAHLCGEDVSVDANFGAYRVLYG